MVLRLLFIGERDDQSSDHYRDAVCGFDFFGCYWRGHFIGD